jgi:tRNA dimethylallyltransferase
MAMRRGAERPRVLALAGPTAAGKTGAALAIAREHDAEIISVDSALVYRGMDIGTAKPSRDERAAVPHHLIDIRDPATPYNAAEFATDATRLVAEIHARGRTVLLVGGTFLYFKALFQGFDVLPAADAALRSELAERGRAEGWPALHAELARVDPATAKRLAPNDAQRIQRALEVFRLSGRPLSAHQTGAACREPSPLAGTPFLSLEPQERNWLHARIEQRFDAMLAQGFVDEVRALRARGDLQADLPSMRCVGYRQAREWLDASDAAPPSRPVPLALLRERGVAATRQLAKRQLTWLRSLPQRQVVPCDAADATARLLEQVRVMLS